MTPCDDVVNMDLSHGCHVKISCVRSCPAIATGARASFKQAGGRRGRSPFSASGDDEEDSDEEEEGEGMEGAAARRPGAALVF